jgi:hypothetical protein
MDLRATSGMRAIIAVLLIVTAISLHNPKAWADAPPKTCNQGPTTGTHQPVGYNVEQQDNSYSSRSGVRANIWTPGGQGTECVRINSMVIHVATENANATVELGWQVGWNCGWAHYRQVPEIFVYRYSRDIVEKCINKGILPTYPEWHFYKLQYANGLWHGFLDGNVVHDFPDLGFSSASHPMGMNAEREFDNLAAGGDDGTTNWGNFDQIQVFYDGAWRNELTPSGCPNAEFDSDPAYTCVKDSNDHYRSIHV